MKRHLILIIGRVLAGLISFFLSGLFYLYTLQFIGYIVLIILMLYYLLWIEPRILKYFGYTRFGKLN